MSKHANVSKNNIIYYIGEKRMTKIIFKIYIILGLFWIATIVSPSIEAKTFLASNSDSAILLESTTGEVIFQKNSDYKRAPASMTKVMSLKIIFDHYKEGRFTMDDMVTTSEYASSMGGSQIFLSVGEQMCVADLIKSIIIASANDACVAMAEFIGGSEASFVEMMNEEVNSMGLKNTHFANATGLPTENHYTTAYDMAIMSQNLLNDHGNEILPISSRYDDYVREGTEKQFWLVNTNKLVRFVEGIDGLKTGWTESAGYCLTATMKKNNIRFIAVAMGCLTPKQRNKDIVDMLNYGVANYELVSIYKKGDVILEKEDILQKPNKYHLVVSQDINILKKKNTEIGKITTKVEDQSLKIFLNDELYQEVLLEVSEKMEKASFLDIFLDIIKKMFG